jgi:dienelactone hydrolase
MISRNDTKRSWSLLDIRWPSAKTPAWPGFGRQAALNAMQKLRSIDLNLRCIFALMLLFLALSGFWQAYAVESSTINVDVYGREINVYYYKPEGAGPFPLLVLSHGSPRKAEDRLHFGAQTLRVQAEAYAASGVAVAVPIRRGYGGNGKWAESYGSCEHPDYYDAGLAGADDIDATIAALSKRQEIDASRVVLMGVSAGGWASLAAATKGGVLGVVNFAGGRGSSGPDTVCKEDNLIYAASSYGGASPHVQELWIYSQNDHFFGPSLAHRLFDAFTTAGGQATFLAAPPYGDDGHKYFDDVSAWKPTVDRFLRQIGFLSPKL